MKLFKCQVCGNILYFENRRCERCGHVLGYVPEVSTLSALAPAGEDWRALADIGGNFRFCSNVRYDTCNWLVPAASNDRLCKACRHNGIIPDLDIPAHVNAWRLIEFAKHRLFYTLLQLRLPLKTRSEDPVHGLIFEFLADPSEDGPKVLTGHDNGLITIALVEAFDSERERRRAAMGEPYRTILGHFRHEIGHHYWDLLVRDGGRLDGFRALFGDDREDYDAALRRHHSQGATMGWQTSFISAYATTHPWEDFAETWAHYLHIIDTIEMAVGLGVRLNPHLDQTGLLHADLDTGAVDGSDFHQIFDRWLPLTFALNSLNRCMGQPDLYPFVIAPPVVRKLEFIHRLVRDSR